MELSDRVAKLRTEGAFVVLKRTNEIEAELAEVPSSRNFDSIIHLHIGEPDFDTPGHIVDAGVNAMKSGKTHYVNPQGTPALRQAILDKARQDGCLAFDAGIENVVVTPGAKPVLFYTMLALVNPGDEVVYPDPGFPIYRSMIDFVGGVAVPMPLQEKDNWRPSANTLKKLVSDKTKLMIINSPQNPTGGIMTKKELDLISELALKHNFMVLSDEIYDQILFDDHKHVSIASYPTMKDHALLMGGFSKNYAMTGWRLGFVVAPQTVAMAITRLCINNHSCCPEFIQVAGTEALKGPQTDVKAMVDVFAERRKVIVEGLNRIGLKTLTPEGAFYVFASVESTGMTSAQLQEYFLEECGVATLDGKGFGECGDGYLRLSYANSVENIRAALERMEKGLVQLNAK